MSTMKVSHGNASFQTFLVSQSPATSLGYAERLIADFSAQPILVQWSYKLLCRLTGYWPKRWRP